MNRTMVVALNTMNQLQKQFDIISHNISNVQTTGYKSRDVTFSDMLAQEIMNQPIPEREVGRNSPFGIRQGVGAQIAQARMVNNQGSIQITDRALDIAFTKPSQYLKVLVSTGAEEEIQFTRNGALYISEDDQILRLVTKEGYPVLDVNNNPITFPNGNYDYIFTDQGDFIVRNQVTREEILIPLGIIQLDKPQFMEQKGDSYIGLPADVPVDNEAIYTDLLTVEERNQIQVQQRALEGSNVDLIKEMTNMMTVQRSLQFQARAISIADQMMGLVNNIR